MAVNKNFVVKNGLEVNTALILADADNSKVGIGTSAPEFTLDVNGGIGATDVQVSGFASVGREFRVAAGGTAFSVIESGNVGLGTTNPAYMLEVQSPVSTGQTALFVSGDVRITGDLSVGDDITYDEVTGRNLSISGVGTIANLGVTDIVVSGASTFTGLVTTGGDMYVGGNLNLDGGVTVDTDLYIIGVATIGTLVVTGTGTALNYQVTGITTLNNLVSTSSTLTNVNITDVAVSGASTLTGIVTTGSDLYVGGDLYVLDDIVYDEVTGRNLNITGVATIANLDGGGITGVATDFVSAVGVYSGNNTRIGTGITTLNFVGGGITAFSPTGSTTATITLPPQGVSIGLAIALGG